MPNEAVGIANGWLGLPEREGVFLSHGDDVTEAHFFVKMGGGRLIDVWEVDVTDLVLESGPDGWSLCRTPIEPARVALVEVWQTGSQPFDQGRRIFPAAS
jgi:hypothetical protein